MKRWKMMILMGVLALSGCAASGENQSEKSLKIGVLSTADSVPLYAALEDELYTQYNVDVELVPFSSASDQSKAAEVGEIDGMMTDLVVQSLINKTDRHLKQVLIACGDSPQQGKFLIVASDQGEYAHKQTLEGARVAISEDTMMEFLVDSYCEELEMDLEKVQKVNVPSIAMRLEMLLEGDSIDCAILPEPLGDYAVLKGGHILIDDTTIDCNLSDTIIAIDTSYIEANRENVERFVEAYKVAAKRINSNPEQYRDLVLRVANVPEDMKESYQIPTFSEGNVTKPELVERIQEWMVDKGLLEQAYTYEEMVDTSFVQ